jgi:CRP/FNR family transcriptional regulator, cyclic AMP receptor protein
MAVDMTARCSLLDEFPELERALPPEERRAARHRAVAEVEHLAPGPWRPAEMQSKPGDLGVMVLGGLMMRDVVLGQTVATELVGRGDILRPATHDGAGAPVPFDVEWTVLDGARVALLDRRFAAAIGRWPELIEALVGAAVRRAQSLAFNLAVCHLRRVDSRLLVLMWHLADRFGSVGPGGVRVPLRLTHEMLGRIVGARRPSVTTALSQLAEEGRLSRCSDGTWTLHGDPPDTLERIRSESLL